MTAALAAELQELRLIEYVRPYLYPKQLDVFFGEERYSITEASTKSGKTTGGLFWLFEKAALTGRRGRNYWWVAPTYSVAKIAYRRMKRMIPRGLYLANESEQTITLPNGAVIWFKGADKPDSLYGEDVYAAVIDEATRCKDEAWHAVRTTLSHTEGDLRVIGNVKGRRNWAYKLARMAEGGAPDMSYHKLTAYDAVDGGILKESEIEDAKRLLPENVFRELYLAEPSDDGGNPFGMDAIRKAIAPLSKLPPVCWGWDLAKSHDYTVGIALDKNGHVCRFERWQAPWETTLLRIRSHTATLPALVDSTGVGDPVLEALQKGGHSNYEGFKFSATSKQQLMEGLAVAIQQLAARYPEGLIVSELETFEYAYSRSGVSYSAPAGLHDDCVCALALAVAKKGKASLAPAFWTLDVAA
jgi:hypothetical protein